MDNALRKARTDLKKVYCKNGLEEDCTSRKARKILCFVKNIPHIRRFVKNRMNRRMRRISRSLVNESWKEVREDLDLYDYDSDQCMCPMCQELREGEDPGAVGLYLGIMNLQASGMIDGEEFQSLRCMIYSNDPGNMEFAGVIIDSMQNRKLIDQGDGN